MKSAEPSAGMRSIVPGHGTFLGVPAAADLDQVDVVLLGIPYDIATHPHRVGSRMGPDHVRYQSLQTRPYLSDLGAGDGHGLRVVDGGNVDVVPGAAAPAFEAIEAAVSEIVAAGAIPVTMGGDGAVTLPQLRALAQVHRDIAVIHFDAHTDCYQIDGAEPFTNATTYTHAASEELVAVEQSFHIGVRGTSSSAGVKSFASETGYRVMSTQELLTRGISATVAEVREVVGDRPVFLCWDMDIFDPSVAPGVCTPEWGGLSAAQGIELIRSLSGLQIIGVDINTVSPPHDPSGLTGSLAARILVEGLHLLGQNPGA